MKCPTCDSPSPNLHPSVQFEGETEPCVDHFHDADDRQSDWLKAYIANKRAAPSGNVVTVDISTVDVLRAELAHLEDQKTRHADSCVGVNQLGYRGPLYFDMQRAYDDLIRGLEQRIAKEEVA